MERKLEFKDEEESFIILGSSPGTSLDMKCNSLANGDALDKVDLEDAMKELSGEASLAFKAHFKLGDCVSISDRPSTASMMAASSIISGDKSVEELQKSFGELLDENVILKETLKQNNDSMKEQFQLLSSCQEDMMRTHLVHKEKFDQTRALVERLRQENKKLKQDIVRLGECERDSKSENSKSGPSSAVEFVSSPDDDTIHKLTSQLELVEKQRRQVIVDNDKLTWQKESLERVVDATSKERDDFRAKLKSAEEQVVRKSNEILKLQATIEELQSKIQCNELSTINVAELQKRDVMIQQLEKKLATLQADFRDAQLKILELENVKLEFSKYKSTHGETLKLHKEHMQDLSDRLKEAQTTVFQPVRLSISMENDNSSEYASYLSNVKLYDRTLKHLSQLFNTLTEGASDSLMESLGLVASLQDFKLDKTNADTLKDGLQALKNQLEKQHSFSLNNIGQVRSSLTIFEGIFKEYNDMLKKEITRQKDKPPVSSSLNLEALTAALVARGQEIQNLESELKQLKINKDDSELLKAQLDLYKSDFEAERESRQKMASEKETLATDLRKAQKKIIELTETLQELHKLNPVVYQNVMSRRTRSQSSGGNNVPTTGHNGLATGRNGPASGPSSYGSGQNSDNAPASNTSTATTGNMIYKCPKCMRFSSDQYRAMEEHFDFCLDDF